MLRFCLLTRLLAIALLSLLLLVLFRVREPSGLPRMQDQNQRAEPSSTLEGDRTLLFVGDTMLSRGVGAKMKTEGDWAYPFRQIAATLSAADLTFGNLECPVSNVGRNLHHRYSFRADPRALEGLKVAGFDVMSVANNHTDDWDRPALLDTLRRLREAGIRPVGAGTNDLEAHYPTFMNLGGLKLAFLAFVNIEPKEARASVGRAGVAWLDPGRVLDDIRLARSLADLVVVSLHWGVEYARRPQREQIILAHQMVDAGADLIVGHHPHVSQPLEDYHGRWIAYSLGNFIFDQGSPEATRHGLMLKVTLCGKGITDVTSIPITISRSFQASLARPEESASNAAHARRRAKIVRSP